MSTDAAMPDTTSIGLKCHCGSAYIPLSLPSSSLPLNARFCACSTCRRSLGFATSILATIPAESLLLGSEDAKTDTLWTFESKFPHGQKGFCDKCGAGLFYKSRGDDGLPVVEILLPSLDLERLSPYVKFDEDLSEVMRRLPRWAFVPGPEGEPKKVSPSSLEGGCACGGVSVKLQRAPDDYFQDPELKEWVIQTTLGIPTFAANYCFCNSCRKLSSAPFFSWLFIPTKLFTLSSTLSRPDGSPAIREYTSSPRVTRRFCSLCGCQASFALRADMWDISPALFDPEALVKGKWAEWVYRGDGEKITCLERYIGGWVENEPSFAEDGLVWLPELVRAYEAFVEDRKKRDDGLIQ